MINLKDIKNNIKYALDEFTSVSWNTAYCIINCQPYDELEDCETIEEIQDWLVNYQLNIDDAKQELQDFNDILEKLYDELNGE